MPSVSDSNPPIFCLSFPPQGEGLFQHHKPGPASPVRSQGPDRLSCPEHSLHHPGHLPALHWPAQQEAQTLFGAQKFQRQLQHTGEHPVRGRCDGLTVRLCLNAVWECVLHGYIVCWETKCCNIRLLCFKVELKIHPQIVGSPYSKFRWENVNCEHSYTQYFSSLIL